MVGSLGTIQPPQDIIDAARAWTADSGRFGEVRGYRGAPLPAPPLDPVRLAPRPSGA